VDGAKTVAHPHLTLNAMDPEPTVGVRTAHAIVQTRLPKADFNTTTAPMVFAICAIDARRCKGKLE
jgi:hypothetical protein